jgi:hypothetical protein
MSARSAAHRRGVAGQGQGRQRDAVAADRHIDRRAQAVEGLVEGAAVAVPGAAARQERGVAVQPLGADRIGGGAAADRDVDPHQRGVGRALGDDAGGHAA